MAKVEATLNYGAEAVLAGASFDDALAEAMARVEETGATFVHAFEDERVIAGQGTIGLELAEQLPERRDVRRARSAAAGSRRGSRSRCARCGPDVRLVGVQAGASGQGTIADGIAVKHPGELTMSILDELLDEIVHVERRGDRRGDHAAARALEARRRGCRRRRRSPRCSREGRRDRRGLRAALRRQHRRDAADLGGAPRADACAGRYLVLRTRVPDRPGELSSCCSSSPRERGNIVEVEHHREGMSIGVAEPRSS